MNPNSLQASAIFDPASVTGLYVNQAELGASLPPSLLGPAVLQLADLEHIGQTTGRRCWARTPGGAHVHTEADSRYRLVRAPASLPSRRRFCSNDPGAWL